MRSDRLVQIPESHQEGPRGAADAPKPRLRVQSNRRCRTTGPSTFDSGLRYNAVACKAQWSIDRLRSQGILDVDMDCNLMYFYPLHTFVYSSP